VHRWSGRTAILLTIPVAYHCIFLLGFGTYDTRVYIHSLLGSVIYGALIAKVILVHSGGFPLASRSRLRGVPSSRSSWACG